MSNKHKPHIKIEIAKTNPSDINERGVISTNISEFDQVNPGDFLIVSSQFRVLEYVLSVNNLNGNHTSLGGINHVVGDIYTFLKLSPKINFSSLSQKVEDGLSILGVDTSGVALLFNDIIHIENIQHNILENERELCIQVFQRESSRAKHWLSEIINETIDLQPFENIKYVRITFSLLSLGIIDLTLLSFKFFHEYFSHFYVLREYEQEDLKFKDGWLFHTIQEFCNEREDALFDEIQGCEFRSFNPSSELCIRNINMYIIDILGDISELKLGIEAAKFFLDFLKQCFSSEANSENIARSLYYKFSWSLMQETSTRFSKSQFIDRLEANIKEDAQTKILLGQCIQNNQALMMAIDIEGIWEILDSDSAIKLNELIPPPFNR
jgi:hypothetical protein